MTDWPALRGKVEAHHRFMLEMQLDRVEDIEANIAVVDHKIDDAIAPHRAVFDHLTTIPGVDRAAAVTVIAELGVDMSVFPTAAHAAAWTGVCPDNNESAGKRMGQQKRRGNVHLATALVQAAFAASEVEAQLLEVALLEDRWASRKEAGGRCGGTQHTQGDIRNVESWCRLQGPRQRLPRSIPQQPR